MRKAAADSFGQKYFDHILKCGRKQVQAGNNMKLKMRSPVSQRHSSCNTGREVVLSLSQNVRCEQMRSNTVCSFELECELHLRLMLGYNVVLSV